MNTIRLFRTPPHDCSYKPEEEAITVFVDPEEALSKPLNSRLTEMGFRRSGVHIYRPDCDHCNACISCRVPSVDFAPRRSQRRIINKNADLDVTVHSAKDMSSSARLSEATNESGNHTKLEDECYTLYRRYIDSRHADGDMYPATTEQYQSFIEETTQDSVFVKFRLGDKLVAVSVMDVLDHGFSAVYTYFDPDLPQRSLGVNAILWQIEYAKQQQIPYLYLGYWIKDCQKMKYKTDFRPLEFFIEGKWLKAT